ncbi:GNAT family N-acetyltransferase [Flavobacterium sp. HSC-61S13]|uniref:GNAT family N-acetyltransferase n=1 Tax=Flavobacterium sp. HSC-61S13 TaxID=2910963 RepID=UPI00209ECF9F|nr:GNAT family N-acetyltransferase [Flavobacterium sp. HSC-61S13]MCP1996906.1 ribosomal protein S18 acetylase RimI-like enzyme [Flavobacterium sp. HSC-61S13]
MIIRAAKIEDHDIVPEMMLQAMEDIVFSFIGKSDIEEAIQFLTHFFRSENNQYSYQNTFVAVDEHEDIWGSITCYDGGKLEELRKPVLEHISSRYGLELHPENETQAGELYLDTLAVAPSAQGKGIGSSLLQHIIQYAREQQYKQVGLLVDFENPNAQKLYERVGFKAKETLTFMGGEYYHMVYDLK